MFFVLAEMKGKFDYNLKNLIKLCKSKINYKTIIITSFDELKQYENDNLKIIIDKHPKNEKGWFTKDFANLYHDTIMKFVNS